MNIEEQKKELRLKLENELYVERFDTFKESVTLINDALKSFNIKYQYTYDDFCADFTVECMKYIDNHPGVNMLAPKEMMLYTLPIVMTIVDNAKNKYGTND